MQGLKCGIDAVRSILSIPSFLNVLFLSRSPDWNLIIIDD